MTRTTKRFRATMLVALAILSVGTGSVAFAGTPASATAAPTLDGQSTPGEATAPLQANDTSGGPSVVKAVEYDAGTGGSDGDVQIAFSEAVVPGDGSWDLNDDGDLADGDEITVFVNDSFSTAFSTADDATDGRLVINSSETIDPTDTVKIYLHGVETDAGTPLGAADANVSVQETSRTVALPADAAEVTDAGAVDAAADVDVWRGEVVALQFGSTDDDFEIRGAGTTLSSFSTGRNSDLYAWNTSGLDASGDYRIADVGPDADGDADDADGQVDDGVTDFAVRDLELTAQVDDTTVTTEDAITGNVTARGGDRLVKIELTEADNATDTTYVTLAGDGVAGFSLDAPNSGTFSIEATDVGTGTTAETETVTVERAPPASATFVQRTITGRRGAVVAIPVSLTNATAATITIGDDEGDNSVGYAANVTVADTSGDGEVVLRWNTARADGNFTEQFSVADADDELYAPNESIGSSDLDTPLATGSVPDAADYPIAVVAGESVPGATPDDIGTVVLVG